MHKSDEFDSVLGRIMQATGCRTQIQLAEILGIRQSSISDAKRRNSVPSEWLLKLYLRLGVNPDWITSGEGKISLKDVRITEKERFLPQRQEHKCLPVKCLPALSEDAPKQLLPIPVSFARPGVEVFKVDGTAMEPLIKRGSYVGVNINQKSVISGEIYCLELPNEGIIIRRLSLDAEASRLILACQNNQHPETSLPLPSGIERIIGRLAWVFQEI